MTQAVSHRSEDNLPTNHSSLIEEVQETLHFVASLKHKTFVAKLGGSTLEYQRAVLQDLTWLHELGVKVVLVHGGGPSITAWLGKLNIPTRFEQGMRVTDAQTLEVVRMAWDQMERASMLMPTWSHPILPVPLKPIGSSF